jgi:seryl-tRNA synthetase
VGKGPADNRVVATWGEIDAVSPWARPHYEIPGFETGIDFTRGSKVMGAGFPFYKGTMAKWVRALVQFFLEEAESNGYAEVYPPLLVNGESAVATGQLPDKEGMMYECGSGYLIPTAEVPVTNLFRDEILTDLPQKICAYTPCFRREAGSWGKEVRGLNRLHQFDKVELVRWERPEEGLKALDGLRGEAERLLQKLELPYRVVLICTGDMGFPHSKQYDLEVWAGGQKRWLEVSSCSYFTDFQARRLNTRYRNSAGQLNFVHTLNGSALAVPRVLAALLENRLREDGSVSLPPVLHRWIPSGVIHFE